MCKMAFLRVKPGDALRQTLRYIPLIDKGCPQATTTISSYQLNFYGSIVCQGSLPAGIRLASTLYLINMKL